MSERRRRSGWLQIAAGSGLIGIALWMALIAKFPFKPLLPIATGILVVWRGIHFLATDRPFILDQVTIRRDNVADSRAEADRDAK